MGAEILLFIEPILDILGVGKMDELAKQQQDEVLTMANNAMQEWEAKKQQLPYTSSEALQSNKPDINWLRQDLYQRQANLYKNFQTNYQKAINKDLKSARNNKILDTLGGLANTVVNTVTFGQANNVVADAQNKWKYENSNKVKEQFDADVNKLKQEEKEIDKQLINSYNKNKQGAIEYVSKKKY